MKQVLVVDDDAVSRLVLGHMLTAQDFEVVEAGSVDEALAVYKVGAFDLVICDYVMPGRNGLDLFEALGSACPPFILLTGHSDRQSLLDGRVSGVSSYLTKPVSTDELTRAVEQVLFSPSA